VHDTKFLGLHTGNTLSWETHLLQILHTLSVASYAIRSIKPHVSQEIPKIVYYANFHSSMSYGLIFWGNSTYSTEIFKIQKKAIRIIRESRGRDSCKDLFNNLKILTPITCSRKKSIYNLNSDTHNINTEQKLNIHQSSSNLSLYQKGVYCFVIKVFYNLPQSIKNSTDNSKQFKTALKHYLHTHPFYSTDECFNVKRQQLILILS
jgi:hypothetical protein